MGRDRRESDAEARRAWVVPPAAGTRDGIDLASLNPADPDDRRFLILAEHPELHEAIRRDADEVEVNGLVFNPRMHITLHDPERYRAALRVLPESWERQRE